MFRIWSSFKNGKFFIVIFVDPVLTVGHIHQWKPSLQMELSGPCILRPGSCQVAISDVVYHHVHTCQVIRNMIGKTVAILAVNREARVGAQI